MESSINVSIAGVAFILDTPAYQLLHEYTTRIETGYKDNPDGGEILSDIEARIAELILSQQSADRIVQAPLIRDIIDQLGLPDDLKQTPDTPSGFFQPIEEGITRRLYRNPEGAKLGGVCSGLGTYFDLEPVIIRLIFVAPMLLLPISGVLNLDKLSGFLGSLTGVAFMLYFILWFAIPKAKTPRQKLEMQGKKITASSIHQTFQEELNTIVPSPRSERSASLLAEFVYVLGRIALFSVKAIALLIGISLVFTMLALIVATVSAAYWNWDTYILTSMIPSGLLAVLIGLLIILPIFVIVHLLMQLVFGVRFWKKTIAITGGIWILILIFVTTLCVRNYDNFQNGTFKQEVKTWFKKGNSYYIGPRHSRERYNREQKEVFMLSDSMYVERIKVGDSLKINDTVHREIFYE